MTQFLKRSATFLVSNYIYIVRMLQLAIGLFTKKIAAILCSQLTFCTFDYFSSSSLTVNIQNSSASCVSELLTSKIGLYSLTGWSKLADSVGSPHCRFSSWTLQAESPESRVENETATIKTSETKKQYKTKSKANQNKKQTKTKQKQK